MIKHIVRPFNRFFTNWWRCTRRKRGLISVRIRITCQFQIILTCFICFISTILGINSLNSAEVPLRNKHTNSTSDTLPLYARRLPLDLAFYSDWFCNYRSFFTYLAIVGGYGRYFRSCFSLWYACQYVGVVLGITLKLPSYYYNSLTTVKTVLTSS